MESSVEIKSRDYWIKVVGMLQQNWALIEANATGGVTIFFISDTSMVFDDIDFPDSMHAELALFDNGFERCDEMDDCNLEEYLQRPSPPFVRGKHPNGRIYSSGRYWR